LVANSWDAGATKVQIIIPSEEGGALIVEDDGCGMTPEQFYKRWMRLGYNRVRHQGPYVEFPQERPHLKRNAFGRNGVGRHGLLCFADSYEVETWRDGKGGCFVVSATSGQDPFILLSQNIFGVEGHGTRLKANVNRNLPDPEEIREILSARFLYDPNFDLSINGKSLPLSQHPGLLDQEVIQITPSITLKALFLDSAKSARKIQTQGIAFWVGNRLVGEPSWSLGQHAVIDGRLRFAKRYTVVVQSDDLFEKVLPDWSGFRDDYIIRRVFKGVEEYVLKTFMKVSAERIQETTETILREHRREIRELQPLARMKALEFLENLVSNNPTLLPETISTAFEAVINLEHSGSGKALLEKLASLSLDDIEALDRLLSEWTIRDALAVLDEVDRRLTVIEAIKKLSQDKAVDELHVLHPLVTQARWLFGPQFESAEYASNVSLTNAVKEIFGTRLDENAFINQRKRPDIVILKDSSLSVRAVEQFDTESDLSSIKEMLILELKRGQSQIGRDEMNQASGYVEDFLNCGLLEGTPYVWAFVIGHEVANKIEPIRRIGDRPEKGRVQATTYGQLVRTAEKRLFNLRGKLRERYDDTPGEELLQKILAEPEQIEIADIISKA